MYWVVGESAGKTSIACMDMAQLKHTYVTFMPAGMLFVTFVAFRCVSVPFAKQWW